MKRIGVRYICLGVLAALLIPLSGCGLLSEEIRLSIEDTKWVPYGTTVQGDGFSVRVPEMGLYLVRDNPMQGDFCLRMRGDWPGGSYNIYPFTLPGPELPPWEAWQIHTKQHMARKFLANYRVLSEHTGVWQGSGAWFQTGYLPGDFVTANCVTRRGTNYYWIVRSLGLLEGEPGELTNTWSSAEHDLQNFLTGLKFGQQTNIN